MKHSIRSISAAAIAGVALTAAAWTQPAFAANTGAGTISNPAFFGSNRLVVKSSVTTCTSYVAVVGKPTEGTNVLTADSLKGITAIVTTAYAMGKQVDISYILESGNCYINAVTVQ